MKCVICKGDDIRLTKVKEEIQNEPDIVFVTIEVPVCRSCGERYYDLRTMRYLEEITQKLREKKIDLRQVGRVLEAI